MGFPLLANIFQSGTPEHARFANFPLQAAVLFSANCHREIAEAFAYSFPELHHVTGQKVAFFSPLTLPDWLRSLTNRQRGWDAAGNLQELMFGVWSYLERTSSGQMISRSRYTYANDVLVREIARTFAVAWDDLPVLVISPNLWLGEYLVVPTDAQRIVPQILALARLVERVGRPDFETLLTMARTELAPQAELVRGRRRELQRFVTTAGEIEQHGREGSMKIVQGLCRELLYMSEMFAITASERMRRDIEMEQRASNRDSAAHQLRLGSVGLQNLPVGSSPAEPTSPHKDGARIPLSATSEARLDGSQDDDAETYEAESAQLQFENNVEEMTGKLATVAAGLAGEDITESDSPTLPVGLDSESRVMIQTSLCVGKFLKQHDIAVDFTPAACGMWKALERELNLSLIQVARRGRGVPMPECFALVDPNLPEGRGIVVTGQDLTVHLNKLDRSIHRERRHCFVTLGKAWHVYRVLHGNTSEGFDNIILGTPGGALQSAHLEAWQRTIGTRNVGSHTRRLDEYRYNQLFADVLTAGLLELLIPIKQHLSGKTTTSGQAVRPQGRV